MYITNNDFNAIKAALNTITVERFNSLSQVEKNAVIAADVVLINLQKKKAKDNKRAAAYIAGRRVIDKNYARSKREATK